MSSTVSCENKFVVEVRKSKTGSLYPVLKFGSSFVSFDKAVISEITNLPVGSLTDCEKIIPIIFKERG